MGLGTPRIRKVSWPSPKVNKPKPPGFSLNRAEDVPKTLRLKPHCTGRDAKDIRLLNAFYTLNLISIFSTSLLADKAPVLTIQVPDLVGSVGLWVEG